MPSIRKSLIHPLVAIAALAAPLPALAQETSATFDLTILGLRAGTFGYSAVERDGQYALNGRLESAGVIGAIRKIRFDGTVSGRTDGTRYTPSRYDGSNDTGRRASQASIQYSNGVPQVISYDPPREPNARDVDPSTQGGTVDPLTGLYLALRDLPAAEACSQRIPVFDGHRRSEFTVSGRQEAAGRVTCDARYTRVDGYSQREMRDPVFGLHMTYAVGEDGMARISQVTADTDYGRATLRRR